MIYNPAPHTPDEERPLSANVNARIASFIHSFTVVIYVGMLMVLVGLGMKYLAITGGSFVFVFAIAVLSLFSLIQIGLSFFYVIANVRLALVGALVSVALVWGYLALLFRFQDWYGWEVMYFIALPLFLLTAIFTGKFMYKHRNLVRPHYNFLLRNLLIPYLFILTLGVTSLAVDIDKFNHHDAGRLHESPLDQETEMDTTDMWRAY